MKRTPLYDEHRALGARMIPFGEWEMPERYTGIIEEHHATRTAAGLFDLSHMGEFYISGPAASDLVGYLLTNDPRDLAPGAAIYSPMCRDDGGIVDDVILYLLPFTATRYLLVVNASNVAKDLAWARETAAHLGIAGDVHIDDRGDETALIAVQGPRALEILRPLLVDDPGALKPFQSFNGEILGVSDDAPDATVDGDERQGVEVMVARTGYTGEDGFEMYVNKVHGAGVWRLLMERGRPHGLLPVGLGARDTLRLEARLALYGNDIDDTTSPLEAGLKRWVRLDDPDRDFRGRDALRRQRDEGVARRLVGLEMEDRAIPRPHQSVLRDGREVGQVTSGTYSPTLGKGIALAYVAADDAPVGTRLAVQVRGQPHPARVARTPFYRRSKTDVGGV